MAQRFENKVMTAEDIAQLAVGSIVPNCFGQMQKVTSIHHKGVDVNGKMFACFYQEFGPTSTMSNSIKEGEAVCIFVGPEKNMQ
jgi:hypothetical protein